MIIRQNQGTLRQLNRLKARGQSLFSERRGQIDTLRQEKTLIN
jgi:hypothetical protein